MGVRERGIQKERMIERKGCNSEKKTLEMERNNIKGKKKERQRYFYRKKRERMIERKSEGVGNIEYQSRRERERERGFERQNKDLWELARRVQLERMMSEKRKKDQQRWRERIKKGDRKIEIYLQKEKRTDDREKQ